MADAIFVPYSRREEHRIPTAVCKQRGTQKTEKELQPEGNIIFGQFFPLSSLMYHQGTPHSLFVEIDSNLNIPLSSYLGIRTLTLRRVYNCFTIFNSPLGTFTSGQTNAGGVRHVPYLDWGAARYDWNRRIKVLNEILIFRLRVWILFYSLHFTLHTSHFLTPRTSFTRERLQSYL